jgi:hypothetical protein
LTLQQFVKTLNEKTEEAANELDITDIHTFTDVIDFNVKHVWYLPPLVTGSLPMVHTSPNYSLKAAEIRKVIPFHISSILKLVSLIVKHALSGGIIS